MRKDQGFTLVEVMVAMVILSLALFELGRLQITALRTTSSAGRVSEATSIAQRKIEEIMAWPYTAAVTAPGLVDATPVGFSTGYPDPNSPPDYTVSWDVDQDNPAPNIKLVRVQVTHQSFGRTRTFILSLRKEQQ